MDWVRTERRIRRAAAVESARRTMQNGDFKEEYLALGWSDKRLAYNKVGRRDTYFGRVLDDSHVDILDNSESFKLRNSK